MADITRYIVKIGETTTEVQPEIATDDGTLRGAFAAFYPDYAGAEVKRSVKDGVQTIELVKQAGPKG